MPTIKQLPAATAVNGSDLLPLSQNGLTRSVTVSAVLSNTQPLLSLAQNTVLGRVSSGAGSPEAIGLGSGLAIQSGTMVATGTDHLSLTLATSLQAGDEVVLNSGSAPRRLPAIQLRSLFSAGSGIQIDSGGVISAPGGSGQGGAGSTGPKGDTGAQGPAGQGFTFRGTWQANTLYAAYDVVTFSGQTYVAPSTIAATSNFSPSSWSLLAAQGAVGPAGPTGPTGPAGPVTPATSSAIGAVRPGSGLTVSTDGALSITNVSLSALAQGGAGVGQLLSWSGTGWAPTSPAPGVSYSGAAPISVSAGTISLAQSGAQTGQVLTWSGSAWAPANPATPSNYAGTAPITVASGTISLSQNGATTGQVLTWNGATWTPASPAPPSTYAGNAPITVASGTISLSQSGAQTGQVLTWNGSAWTPASPASPATYVGTAPIAVASGTISLSQNGATAGQVLTWNGSAWTPVSPPSSPTYTGSAPITVASGVIGLGQNGASSGQVLTWSGSAWVPQQPAASGASVGTAIPLANGTAAAGTATTSSREDHRHPTDATRAPLSAPVFTTSITLPTWTTSNRPASPAIGMEGFATDTGRRETYTAAGWVQYVRVGDLPSAAGQLLGGASIVGGVTPISIGSGLSLSGTTLSATSSAAAVSGVSIDGTAIAATSSNPYQMATADRVIDVNKTNAAPTKILLPTNPTLWVEYTIIDGKGDAASNNITIAAASGTTINGQASFVMNAGNDAISLRAVSPTVWRIA